MGKRAKNLLLDEEVLSRAEEYCRAHGITLSALIEDFLKTVPLDGPQQVHSPTVWEEMIGVANYGPLERETYRDYLNWHVIETSRKRR